MISIIVPVYNTEKWLHRCVDSLLAQTYTDFEVLLINDGSTDGSGVICDEYAIRDPRVRAFHKSNGGVSSARNLGLDNAKGEWINFVDSDDWVESHYLEVLINQVGDSDLSICDFKLQGTNDKWTDKIDTACIEESNLATFYTEIYPNCEMTAPWAKLLKHEYIKKERIRFDESLHTIEDTLFILDYLYHVKSIVTTHEKFYNYWRGEVGLSNPNLQKTYTLVAASKILNSLNRLAKVCPINVNLLFEKIIGGYIYDYVFVNRYTFIQTRNHFRNIDIELTSKAMKGGGNIISRKYKFILHLIITGHYTIAAFLYKFFYSSANRT